ncbi:MAG: haloalkane dehalogenase [Deltaproteobacteria bacterium]|nr:haloalkane dehalogenase [Deltaproteobacteria bacterium]
MSAISAADPHPRKRVSIEDSEMSYVDTGGQGPIAVFLHGNPTSSYLWRNVIKEVAPVARCLAPDLIGMGDSCESSSGYRFVDHRRYLDAWFDAVVGDQPVFLVIHDWGSGLGFHWARRHPEQVRGIAYMEAIVRPLTSWDDWAEGSRKIFKAMRSPAGEEIILTKNVFIERILPSSIIRKLGDEEMTRYRARFTEPGECRRPTLSWPRQIPIGGEPRDVHEIVEAYSKWLQASDSVPKLFINADPGIVLIGPQREFARQLPNQEEITVKGLHFIQEDSPAEIGEAVARFLQAHG